MKETLMPAHSLTFAIGTAALVIVTSVPKLAVSAQDRMELGALSNNQGIFVDRTKFRMIKGTTKSDPAPAQLTKLGAQEVKDGAIIIRVGDKLYLVDTDPSAKSPYSGWAADAFGGGGRG
jgi:hypothetical protein